MDIIITEHAYRQARKRIHWNKSAIKRMSEKAYEKGISHKEAKGKLKRYIDKIILQDKSIGYRYPNNIKIYGSYLYMFANNVLITIYNINNKLVKSAENIRG